ncbi:hypothetical protein B0T14DRAFT_403750, partial [Immersiella caudata]
LSLGLGAVLAAEVVYVTELEIYSSLSALYYNVQRQTADKCPTDATELQGCICTKNNNIADVKAGLTSSVSYSCGSTASDDHASVATVLSAYCNQESTFAFPTPAFPVEAYITEVAEIAVLAPCAASALGWGLNSLTYSECPSDAPALASCVCTKNRNSQVARSVISSSAKYSCSSHTPDVSSALAFFDAYCAMGNGTSVFPMPSNPPGDMTYYITDLPGFTSLARCAKSAISYAVQYQTNDLCPGGPQALASCACIKEGMTKDILSSISSNVRNSCDSTATDDISSAVGLYNLYCSAALSLTVPTGISTSVEQIYPTGAPLIGSPPNSPGASSTSKAGNGTQNGASDGSTATGGPSVGVIAGVVAGVVVVLALVGVLVFFLMKSARKRKALEQLASDQVPMTRPGTSPGTAGTTTEYFNGKQELPADSLAAPLPPPSPSPSMLKPGLSPHPDTVSPVSAHNSAFTPPPPSHAELNGQAPPMPPMPHSAELPGQHSPYPPPPQGAELQGQASMYPPTPNTAELYGQGAGYQHPPQPELQGQGAMYAPPPNRPELQGQGSPYGPLPTRPELQGQGSPYVAPNPGPYRQELAGQYQFPQQQQYLPPQQGYSPYSPQSQHSQMSPQSPYSQVSPQSPPMPGMGWQSGPVPGVHEM